jgi:succinate dehydrogenase / fumarate reductase, cytochrome b subunit
MQVMRDLFGKMHPLPSPGRLALQHSPAKGGANWTFDGTELMPNRPLSPHLSIWKWGPHMLVSILHRITGDGMALVGLAVLLWWLGALAAGRESFEAFAVAMGSPLGVVVLVALSWAFFNHMSSGIRHFVLDIGAGYELKTNKRFSVVSVASGIFLTIAFWAIILTK